MFSPSYLFFSTDLSIEMIGLNFIFSLDCEHLQGGDEVTFALFSIPSSAQREGLRKSQEKIMSFHSDSPIYTIHSSRASFDALGTAVASYKRAPANICGLDRSQNYCYGADRLDSCPYLSPIPSLTLNIMVIMAGACYLFYKLKFLPQTKRVGRVGGSFLCSVVLKEATLLITRCDFWT